MNGLKIANFQTTPRQQIESHLNITGWSLKRQCTYSLKAVLESASRGFLSSYLHYPELATTYSTLRCSPARAVQVVSRLQNTCPLLRVEVLSADPALLAEKRLESPATTACVDSEKSVSELALFELLGRTGTLRALRFGYSARTQQWSCRASYYESYSLQLLLGSSSSLAWTLADGTLVSVERVKKSPASRRTPFEGSQKNTYEHPVSPHPLSTLPPFLPPPLSD